MGTALSTTGNIHHTPCLIGVAISPLNPKAPRLVMGSSAEENDGVRVSLRGEQCVYSSGAHCISIRMMFRLFITERKGNIHWNVPSRVEASKAALKQLPACHATRGKTEEPYDPQRTTT